MGDRASLKGSIKNNSRGLSALLGGTALALVSTAAFAQDADPGADAAEPAVTQDAPSDMIVVTGIRATIQGSIDSKRDSVEVFDALSADEIGDIPALSIGEALETLTGAGSHREQGGATEISIRGLGPFLGSTVINGRVATNGSGDRSVNFSQFPSELFSKVGIYKTQAASYIEGGVAGQIVLETIKPIDYGRRRVQGQFKLNYNPENFDIREDQRLRDLGYRGTISFVDQFELGEAELGISLGYQRNRATNPEQEAAVSNTIRACVVDPTTTSDGVFDDGNCDTSGSTVDGLRDGSVTDDFIIARNSYFFRQNRTDDQRDAFFGALQFKPTPAIDFNADFQYSKRDFQELRSDLVFSEGRRIDGPGDPNRIDSGNPLDFPLTFTNTGALRQFTNETRIEATSHDVERREEYYGGGASLAVQATDRLDLSLDGSYSRTQRFENQIEIRMRTRNTLDVFGNDDAYPDSFESDGSRQDDRVETATLIRQNGSQIPNFFVQEFDVTNHNLFAGDARARYDLDQDRFNEIWGVRGDFEYSLDGFFNSIMGGARFQNLDYRSIPGGSGGISRFQETYSESALFAANRACRIPFPESGFLQEVSGGNPLVTNVDQNGNVIGTANSYAAFDAKCLAQVLEANDPSGLPLDDDGVPIFPTGEVDSVSNTDVNEKSWAGYVQANFDSDLGALPVRGNFGVRVVKTEVSSLGFRTTLSSSIDPATGEISLQENSANLVTDVAEYSYTQWLPSFNMVAELRPELLGRVAVYRAMSRPDPSSLSFGRQFDIDSDDEFPTVEDAIGVVEASGNPFTDPLMSWNFDVGLEWYPNEDSILAINAYYKNFNGGFEIVGQQETFLVDGTAFDAVVETVQTTTESSRIYGIELTAAHRLSWLPAPLDGLGFKLSYNYADSNFEFEDDSLGAVTIVNADGTLSTKAGLIVPANLFGFSKHVLSAQVYYQIGRFDMQGVYKYRSRYFQQFVNSPGRIRYTDDVNVFEARVSYELTDNIRFTLEGLNLFGEPRTDFRGAPDDLGQVLFYGPRYFAGVRFKF